MFFVSTTLGLKEHIPVKQGLRPLFNETTIIVPAWLKEHIPVKQGLRHLSSVSLRLHLSNLKEHIPVKQGLRLLVPRYKVL